MGTTDYHYETWYAASNFLSYGGKLDIVRCVGGDLNTANVAVGLANTTLLLEGLEDYNNNQADDTNWYFAAKNPGHWSENIKVAIIDNAADQTIPPTLETGRSAASKVGCGVTPALTGVTVGGGSTAAGTGISIPYASAIQIVCDSVSVHRGVDSTGLGLGTAATRNVGTSSTQDIPDVSISDTRYARLSATT